MKIFNHLINKIKLLCLEEEVPHYKVIPYVEQFYKYVSPGKVYDREIINTAKHRIAELKNLDSMNDATVIAQRNDAINDNKTMSDG